MGRGSLARSGGTDFDEPVTWALDVMTNPRMPFGTADLVLVSDGECTLGDAPRDRLATLRASRGIRAFGCLIGGTPEDLGTWCDTVWAAAADDDTAATIFQAVV